MDFIPLVCVCGTRQHAKALGPTRPRPNCGAKAGAGLFEKYSRFCCCFIPLWKTGGGTRHYRCGHCGASYPA